MGVTDVRRDCPIKMVKRTAAAVQVVGDVGEESFDHIVLACHPDQSLGILAEPSPSEREILGAIRYQDNLAVLHTDVTFLPRRKQAWASWNYHVGADSIEGAPVSLTYLINRLQPLPFKQQLLVTLNPSGPPPEVTILGRYRYAHPLFAWARNGFHEDGLASSIAVTRRFGVTIPWAVEATA